MLKTSHFSSQGLIEFSSQPTEWAKTIANQVSDMRLIVRLYQELLHQKTKNSTQKKVKGLTRHLSKEDKQMANKYTNQHTMPTSIISH